MNRRTVAGLVLVALTLVACLGLAGVALGSTNVPSWWIDRGETRYRALTVEQPSVPPPPDPAIEYFTVELTVSDHNSGLMPPGIEYRVPAWMPPVYADWQVGDAVALWLDRATHANDGIFALDYRATDKSGNTMTASAAVKIDTRPPATDGAAGWINGLEPYVLTAVDQVPGAGVAATVYRVDQSTPWSINEADPVDVTLETEIMLTGLQGSTHTIDFASVDAALPFWFDAAEWAEFTTAPKWHLGNWELDILNIAKTGAAYKSETVRLDTMEPTTTVSPDTAAWHTDKPVVLTFTASDPGGSGVDYTEYNVAGNGWVKGTSVAINAEGSAVVEYRSVDMVGIVETTKSTTVNIDTVDPVTMVTGATDGWSATPVTLTFSATDATSGVAYTEYSTDNGSTWTPVVDNTLGVSDPGETTVWYRSADVAGNVEAMKSVIVQVDSSVPVTTVTGNDDAWHKTAVTLDFSAEGGASGIDYTEWSTDGSNWTKGNSAIVSVNGEITVSYRSVSNAGVVEPAKTVMVKVSTTRPTVTAENASVKRGKKATFRFNVTAITPTATSVTIEIRTKSGRTLSAHRYANVPTMAQVSRSFKVDLKKGKYAIRIGAVDEAGNVQSLRGAATLTVR